jgi:YbbR domain-containing protein
MPFQDTDDLKYRVPPPPGALERWLRRIFVEDLNIKLISLGITLVLWFAVTGQKTPMSKRFNGVQLTFVHADDMAISSDPLSKVDVTLTGDRDKLAKINPADLIATVLISDHTTGDRVIRLSRERVKIDPLDPSVQIERFQPSIVSLRLEPRMERQVYVDLKFEGKVPAGYEVYAVTPSPASVRVRGPASIVNAIQKAPTESILLDGKTSSFDLPQVAVDIPDQRVDVIDGIVQVHVEIGEHSVTKTFNNVVVQSPTGHAKPETATLTLSAPSGVFNQLHSEDIRLVVAGGDNGLSLALPTAIQGKVKLVSVKPATFSTGK